MDMGSQGAGRKRLPNRERLTAEDDALNQIAREVSVGPGRRAGGAGAAELAPPRTRGAGPGGAPPCRPRRGAAGRALEAVGALERGPAWRAATRGAAWAALGVGAALGSAPRTGPMRVR